MRPFFIINRCSLLRGFGLIEVLIASLILSSAILAFITVNLKSLQMMENAFHRVYVFAELLAAKEKIFLDNNLSDINYLCSIELPNCACNYSENGRMSICWQGQCVEL